MNAANLFEFLMILCFGLSWPISVIRSYKSRSTKGKSIIFNYFIAFGYICGIISKNLFHNYNLAYYFYFPNLIMVTIDILLYYRNRKIEAAQKV